MIELNKWYRLIIILSIFYLLVNIFSRNNKSNKKEIKEGFTSAPSKCTYSKDKALEDIKKEKVIEQQNISKCNECEKEHSKEGKCAEGCSDLLPVLDPMYNMREMCKQIILLEDHLFQKKKRCHDCICKHFLTIEALAEEAITLDKNNKYTKELSDLPDNVRAIAKIYINNHDDPKQPAVTAQKLRQIRKGVMQKCFKHF
jgi:hypothetical protein